MLDFAVRYAVELGWRVFPVYSIVNGACTCREGAKCGHSGKHPRTAHGLTDASTDVEHIRAWWKLWPNANIGVACGDRIAVLDVDPRNGGDRSLERLSQVVGGIPETVEATTGGGGRHLIFRQAATPMKSGNMGPGYPGLDRKGDGGYIIVAPSCHASGGVYTWVGAGPWGGSRLADVPTWLGPVGVGRERPPAALCDGGNRQTAGAAGRTFGGNIPTGARNDTLFRDACARRAMGASDFDVLRFLRGRNGDCLEPLSGQEIEMLYRSVIAYPCRGEAK